MARAVARFEAFQHSLMAAHADEFTTVDLTMAQAKLLYVVMAAGELSLTEIAGRLRVTPSTASGAVDHLVGLDLLTRADDPANRRQIRVSITGTASRRSNGSASSGAPDDGAVLRDQRRRPRRPERAIGIMSDAVATLEAAATADTPPTRTPRSAE